MTRDMLRVMAIGVGLLWVPGRVALGENAAVASQAAEARINELTAEYTLLYSVGQTANAITAATKALAAVEQAFGPDHERVAQVLNDLGHLQQLQSEFGEAEKLHQRALTIRERIFNSDGPAVAQSLNNLGKAYHSQGRDAQAETVYTRSLSILERHVPLTDPSRLVVLEAYEQALRSQGKTVEADAVAAMLKTVRSAQ